MIRLITMALGGEETVVTSLSVLFCKQIDDINGLIKVSSAY
jgi:hypothetical protein